MSRGEFRLNVIHKHLHPHSLSQVPVSSEELQYSQDGGRMTEQDRRFYEENGFLVVRGLVPQHCLETYKERFQKICDGTVKVPGMTTMKDVSVEKLSIRETTLNKIQDFQFDDVLFGYCVLPQILDYAQSVTGPNIMAMHTMLINKPPDTGSLSSRHPLHQDLHYFPFRPADRIVCSWTAMEPVHRQNGCLVVQPGSHKAPGRLLEHGYPQWAGGVNKMYHGITELGPDAPRQHLEMGPGDTVFFHPLLIHGSGTNRTKGFRKAISCHYAASDCVYIDVQGTLQQNLAEEIMEVAQRRVGKDVKMDYKDVWYVKSRLARGERLSL